MNPMGPVNPAGSVSPVRPIDPSSSGGSPAFDPAFNPASDSAFNPAFAPASAASAAQSGRIEKVRPFGSRTDVGYVREHNEDNLLVAPPLYVVCDGMGGHEGGEVASEIAVDTISRLAPAELDAEALGRAVEEANLAVIQGARDGIGKEGMGTTCTAAMLEGEKLVIAQVGDSRAYLLHNGVLQQITRDHSVVADLVESGEISPSQARTHQWRSYITRALGLDPYMQADLYEINVAAGDRLMLCSDGLYSMVPDEGISEVLQTVANPQDAADVLVDEALAGGGNDNVTVIVVDVTGYSPQKTRKIVRRGKFTAALIIALMVLIIGGVAAAFGFWVNTSAYLGEQDGKVAIYRGVPGDFLGMSFSNLEEVTDVQLDSLQAVMPGPASRIREGGVACDSLDAAKDLVSDYKREISKKGGSGSTEGASSSSSASSSGSNA